ncbi:MAG: hypothetical protein LQ351_000336 [Letrouitia transgressa]|nr:MAG: hypothetical protein LQ351_000336 [Letrouitia transgressa]
MKGPKFAGSNQSGWKGFEAHHNEGSVETTRTTCNPPQITHRSVTAPNFVNPFSGVAKAQDCAFPPFPTSKSRTATPMTPADRERSFAFNQKGNNWPQEDSGSHSPISPKHTGGGSVLQRITSIAYGPSNMNKPRSSQSSSHRRTATMGSNKDFTRPSYAESRRSHSQRPSISTAKDLRHLSLSSIAGGPKSTVNRDDADSPTLPAVPTLTQGLTRSPERVYTKEQIQRDQFQQQESRSHTYPLNHGKGNSWESKRSSRRPSETAVAAAIRPLHEIGSTSSFKPSKSIRDWKKPIGTGTADTVPSDSQSVRRLRNDTEFGMDSSISKLKGDNDPGIMVPYHTPSESNSSSDSFGSGARSASSASTPLSGSPGRPKRRPSNTGHIDHLLGDFRFGTDHVPVIEEPKPQRRNQPPSFSRPMYARPSDPSAPPAQVKETVLNVPLSPRDPAIQSARPHLTQASSDLFAPTIPLENGSLRLSPVPAPPQIPLSLPRKPTAANKGKCRGCGDLIKGKSVSSADGRLTGRYHRSCFVCKTCQEPFQTADFYVLDNHPYCGRHYHQLSGSLCASCDRGIEGQYLETELKKKFHPHCFTCQDCRRILRDDYFEMNGKTYCEHHAFRAAQQTSLLGPGRRHPERRTTRLIMT